MFFFFLKENFSLTQEISTVENPFKMNFPLS